MNIDYRFKGKGWILGHLAISFSSTFFQNFNPGRRILFLYTFCWYL